MNKHLLALEFDKILEKLAEYTCCDDSRELAFALRPVHRLDEAQALMNQTHDAHMLLARFGGPSFGGMKNVNNALHRADAGSTLSMRELLDIAQRPSKKVAVGKCFFYCVYKLLPCLVCKVEVAFL